MWPNTGANVAGLDTPSFKLCICGHHGVGKTALLHRRITSNFLAAYRPTIAASFATVIESVDNTKVILNIWDTAGQETYQSMMPLYFRAVKCVLLVVDVTNSASWDFTKRWVDHDLIGIAPRPLVFLATNKSDLEPDPRFQTEISNWAKGMAFPTFATSAVEGTGIDELFLAMAKALLATKLLRPTPMNEVLSIGPQDQSNCC
jgi:small GTP-binding protein